MYLSLFVAIFFGRLLFSKVCIESIMTRVRSVSGEIEHNVLFRLIYTVACLTQIFNAIRYLLYSESPKHAKCIFRLVSVLDLREVRTSILKNTSIFLSSGFNEYIKWLWREIGKYPLWTGIWSSKTERNLKLQFCDSTFPSTVYTNNVILSLWRCYKRISHFSFKILL